MSGVTAVGDVIRIFKWRKSKKRLTSPPRPGEARVATAGAVVYVLYTTASSRSCLERFLVVTAEYSA
jgi:hypothetical protein